MKHPQWLERERALRFAAQRDQLWSALFVRYFTCVSILLGLLIVGAELPAPVAVSLGCAALVCTIAVSGRVAQRRAAAKQEEDSAAS